MPEPKTDTRFKERLVVLVPVEFKDRIAKAAAISAVDEGKISNLVRRAVDELIDRERLLETADERGAA